MPCGINIMDALCEINIEGGIRMVFRAVEKIKNGPKWVKGRETMVSARTHKQAAEQVQFTIFELYRVGVGNNPKHYDPVVRVDSWLFCRNKKNGKVVRVL